MPAVLAFGRSLPERVLGNAELAARLNCDAKWILEACGIEERRVAEPGVTVADLAELAARDCIGRAGVNPAGIGLIILSSATSERRFPGPAAILGEKLGLAGVPAIDLPVASAGSVFALALAAQLAPAYGLILVVAAEKMAGPGLAEPLGRNVGILFGDGAGACLVTAGEGPIEILNSVLHSDGTYAESLKLEFSGPVQMDGRTVILQAGRRIPAVIQEVLAREGVAVADVKAFVMHQANSNLTDRVAKVLGVPAGLFFSNIDRCGNTSSASMLIAASAWWEGRHGLIAGDRVCFAGFGAGFHWGAVLARINVKSV